MDKSVLTEIKKRLSDPGRTRILAFGSSNTDRYLYGMHWFDVVNLGMREKYGAGKNQFINIGISGNTAGDLLNRFHDDAEFYKPHIVFLTIGGNDSNPARGVTGKQFRENLMLLQKKFSEMGTLVIFQTYYSPDPAQVEKMYLENFYSYMNTVREIAAATDSGLIDHLKRWELLRMEDNSRYLKMMLNGFHVNETGNILMGIDILKNLEIKIPDPVPGNMIQSFDEAVENQKLMDKLGSE